MGYNAKQLLEIADIHAGDMWFYMQQAIVELEGDNRAKVEAGWAKVKEGFAGLWSL
jgi:hypothetical protein